MKFPEVSFISALDRDLTFLSPEYWTWVGLTLPSVTAS